MRYLVTAVTVIAVLACESPSVTVIEDVEIRKDRHGITFTNGTSAPIYVWAVDSNVWALSLVVLCGMQPVSNPSSDCGPLVPPGESHRFAKDAVYGWGTSGRLTTIWWHLIQNDEGLYVLDRLRATTVPG